MKKKLVMIILVTTLLMGCNAPKAEPLETAPLTNALKAVTDEVTESANTIEETSSVGGMKRLFNETDDVKVYFSFDNGKLVIKDIEMKDNIQAKVLDYNEQYVKIETGNRTYIGNLSGDSPFIINEQGILSRDNYTLEEVTPETELPEVKQAFIPQIYGEVK